MIPQTIEREVASMGATDSAAFGISERDSAHVMTILRDTLYSDKIMAVLREYASNAWDANREAGHGDKPIRVLLPTILEPSLSIRDDGPGLSRASVMEIFSQYGASTKRGSNTAVGMLGIGSKSGFAYSDSFTVISWHSEPYDEDFIGPRCGMRSTYVAVIDKSEKGRIDLLHETACDPRETGVEIRIAAKIQDISAFESRAKKLFSCFVPRPEINIDLPPSVVGKEVPGLGIIDEKAQRYEQKWVAVMGCVPYHVDLAQLSGGTPMLSRHASNIGGIVHFDIGELQVAASREGLKYGDSTKAALIKRINGIIDEYVRIMLEGLDLLTPWEQRLRVVEISNKGLPIPDVFKHLTESAVDLELKRLPDGKPLGAFRMTTFDRFDKRSIGTNAVTVNRMCRLILKDDKRTIRGYTLGSHEIIVVPLVGYEPFQAKRELLEKLKLAKCDGIQIIPISTLPWVAPSYDGAPRDPAKARARCFILDPGRFSRKRPSEAWSPVDRIPLDTDVHVVLEGYRITNMEEFPIIFREDRTRLQSIGLKMPEIIGYKSTDVRPINRAKLKGTDYRTWRTKGMLDLLLSAKGDYLQTFAWNELNSHYRSMDLEKDLGKDHLLVEIERKINGASKSMAAMVYNQREVVRYVHGQIDRAKLEAKVAMEEIKRLYPLLSNYGLGVLSESGNIRQGWIDYVKMVDELSSARAKQPKFLGGAMIEHLFDPGISEEERIA